MASSGPAFAQSSRALRSFIDSYRSNSSNFLVKFGPEDADLRLQRAKAISSFSFCSVVREPVTASSSCTYENRVMYMW